MAEGAAPSIGLIPHSPFLIPHSLNLYTVTDKLECVGVWTASSVAGLRAALGLTQAEFARAIGVRQQTVSEWETGCYEPRGASARMLSILAEQRAPYDDSPGGAKGGG